VPIPSKFTAGDRIVWKDDAGVNWLNQSVSSTDYTCKYYLRSLKGGALTVTGTADSLGWEFVISASDSANLEAGAWRFQAIASKSGDDVTLYRGRFFVDASLSYTGSTPGPFDDRTTAEEDLASVQDAIRQIVINKASEYTIGDRTFKYLDLSFLRRRESELKAEVVREKRASMIANGLGDPHSWKVRF
tara:strand:- start:1293 stop:1859 length:567 start_codon:yes stop_codon:yes gene_type:complete